MPKDFIKDTTHLRKSFPPQAANEWNFAALADLIQITRELHGWELYPRRVLKTSSGANSALRTIAGPSAGFMTLVLSAHCFFEGGGPLDMTLEINETNGALAAQLQAADFQRLYAPEKFILLPGDFLRVATSAATGIGNSLKLNAWCIDLPDTDYVRGVS